MIQLWIYKTLEMMKLVRFSGGWAMDDLDFGLSEAMKALNVGGRHLDIHVIECGFYEDDEEELNLMILR